MKFYYLLFGSLLFLMASCSKPYELKLNSPKTLPKDGKFRVSVSEKNNQPIDSVIYLLNGKRITDTNLNLSTYKLGKHVITAKIFYNDKDKTFTNTVLKLAENAPKYYNYEIVNEYKHDHNAFTQGLEFYKGYIYESTGQNGASSIRKVDLKTGKVLQRENIDAKYFGEGMTIFNDKIHLLTWKAKTGFVYDIKSFEKEKSFNYGSSQEGWGFTHNDTHLIKSDGTKKLWFINPDTHKEDYFIEAYTNSLSTSKGVSNLNELEYVKDKIYANVWQKNFLLIINPKNGAIEGLVDLSGLQKRAGQSGSNHVLNGIAYDSKKDRLFVTGKYWNKLFEIKISNKQ